jgi:hypothetical protein
MEETSFSCRGTRSKQRYSVQDETGKRRTIGVRLGSLRQMPLYGIVVNIATELVIFRQVSYSPIIEGLLPHLAIKPEFFLHAI